MTAEPYAAAAGLIERSAAAYVSCMPEHPADNGFFGPASVTWKITGELGELVVGLRALMMQALHPLAMAGVDQHSHWRQDPIGRLVATSSYLTTVSFGERASAEQAAARVRRIHTRVRGVDPETGRPYEASDPALLLWVHAALIDSYLAVLPLFGARLGPGDADRYVAEMVVAAELVGVPAALIPSSVAELDHYIASVQPELRCTQAARESMGYALDLPGMDEDIAEIWQDIRDGAIAALPDWAREMYGYSAPPLTPGRREEIRQVLGVLDALFLGEPGVLEARQRIAARVRAAQHA
jgi:uncharacterized protein (DUF2236 family)